MKNYMGTFGGSLAALRLNQIMNEKQDPRLINVIGKHISKFEKVLKEIYFMKDYSVREEILQMYRKNFINKVTSLNLEKSVETHILCHCSTFMKKLFNEGTKNG